MGAALAEAAGAAAKGFEGVGAAAGDVAAAAGASLAGACRGIGESGLGDVLLTTGGSGEEGGGPSVAWSSGGDCAGDSGGVGGTSGSEGGKVYTAAAHPLNHLQTRANKELS